jgi:hypothetical protein
MSSRSTTALMRFLTVAFMPLGMAPHLPAQQVSSHTLVYAVYEGEHTAGDVLASLRKKQHAAGERLVSYAVISKSLDGKLTVRERPTPRGSAIELLLSSLGNPPGESAQSAGVISPRLVDSAQASLTPGSSAVIALMDDRWVQDLQRDLQAARARAVMASVIAQDAEEGTP